MCPLKTSRLTRSLRKDWQMEHSSWLAPATTLSTASLRCGSLSNSYAIHTGSNMIHVNGRVLIYCYISVIYDA
jgi:hypothetical protein